MSGLISKNFKMQVSPEKESDKQSFYKDDLPNLLKRVSPLRCASRLHLHNLHFLSKDLANFLPVLIVPLFCILRSKRLAQVFVGGVLDTSKIRSLESGKVCTGSGNGIFWHRVCVGESEYLELDKVSAEKDSAAFDDKELQAASKRFADLEQRCDGSLVADLSPTKIRCERAQPVVRLDPSAF